MPKPDIKTTANLQNAEQANHVSPSAMLAKLTFGALVQVSSPDGAIKYLTRLIGVDGTKTLITALPTPKQLKKETVSVVYDNLFFPEKLFVMRLIAQGSVFAFESEVTAVNYNGCKLLLTRFPKQIQCQTLRQDARFPCALASQFQFENTEATFSGVIMDISQGGCQLHFDPTDFGDDLELLKSQTAQLTISFNRDEQAAELAAKVVSINKIEKQEVVLGMAFSQEEKAVKDYIESLQLGDLSSKFLS